jgi:outer membrane protein assembly factor BamB
VVFVPLGPESFLLAVDSRDGREKWKTRCPLHNTTWSSPAQWTDAGGERVGLACAGRFTAFDAGTGREVWWTDGLARQVCATPVCSGRRLVLSSASVQGERSNITVPPAFEEFLKGHDQDGDGKISYDEIPADYLYTNRQASDGAGNMTLRDALGFFGGFDKSKPLDRQQWEKLRGNLKGFQQSEWNNSRLMVVDAVGEGDVTASCRVWQETRGVPEIPSPLVYGGRLYLVRSGGLVACRDLETGKLVYEERLGAPGAYYASPVAADGRIYTVSDAGVVTVIRAGDTYTPLARNDLGERILATPALSGNAILVRSVDHLWAFGAAGQ